MRPDSYQVDEHQRVWVGGVPVEQLVKEYGTPLYILDYQTIMSRLRLYQDALRELDPTGVLCYAGKAFLSVAMAGLLEQQQTGLDVVSGGELYTALRGGFSPSRIMYHGNVKTASEVQEALRAGVGHFVVDSLAEMALINEKASQAGVKAPVLLRLTPGIEAHTHAFIQTGQFDSKFGFAMADGIADDAVDQAFKYSSIDLLGFHAHIGSQILEEDPFLANAERLLSYSREWYDRTGWWPRDLNIGGGFGVRYEPEDEPPRLLNVIQKLQGLLERWTPAGKTAPKMYMEPGRSIVAEAGMTVYRIGALKTVPGGKTYVAVDGGMGDNIRPALYQAPYYAVLDRKAKMAPRGPVTVAGRYCESGDILIPSADLPEAEVGDLLMVFATGAYNYSMASNYNRVPRPAVVLVGEGRSQLWIQREQYEDLVRLDQPWRSL